MVEKPKFQGHIFYKVSTDLREFFLGGHISLSDYSVLIALHDYDDSWKKTYQRRVSERSVPELAKIFGKKRGSMSQILLRLWAMNLILRDNPSRSNCRYRLRPDLIYTGTEKKRVAFSHLIDESQEARREFEKNHGRIVIDNIEGNFTRFP